MLRQKPAYSCHQSYVRWISAVHVATDKLILQWPSHKLFLPKTSTTTPSKSLCHFWHWSRLTLRLLKAAKPLIRRLEERRRSTITKRKLGKTPAPRLPMSIWLTFPAKHATAEIKKTQARPSVITVTRRSILQRTIPNLEKTRIPQKTSIGLGHLHSDDWH